MLRNTAIFRCPEADSLNSNDENACDDSCVQGPRMQNILENDSSNSMCPKSGDMQPIAREFRQHYERKLREICDDNNKECVQAKMKLQEDWIRDLTEQNEMLIKAVIELESEATERVKMLEAKLNESETCNCEVINGWRRGRVEYQMQEHLESDVRNLLKLLRRCRTSSVGACGLTENLHFNHVSAKELSEALELDLDPANGVGDNEAKASQPIVPQTGGDGGTHKLRVSLEILESSCGYDGSVPSCCPRDSDWPVEINHTEPFAFPPPKTRPLPTKPTKFSYSQQHY